MKTIYTIPAPDSLGAMIEVYGEPENAWYEWRIIDGGRTVRDTGTEGHSAFQGRQYGQAEIALRDALMFASGLPIDGDTPTDAASLGLYAGIPEISVSPAPVPPRAHPGR